MQRFIVNIIVFTVISTFCLSVFAQDWQDEQHVWDEEKGEWVVKNKAVIHAPQNIGADNDNEITRHTEEWAKYLPRTVRNGKREATSWEISEAQRKLWVKHVIAQRSAAKAEQRRQLIAHRKATGWYAARRNGNHNAIGWPMQMHMSSVNSYIGGGRYGY